MYMNIRFIYIFKNTHIKYLSVWKNPIALTRAARGGNAACCHINAWEMSEVGDIVI